MLFARLMPCHLCNPPTPDHAKSTPDYTQEGRQPHHPFRIDVGFTDALTRPASRIRRGLSLPQCLSPLNVRILRRRREHPPATGGLLQPPRLRACMSSLCGTYSPPSAHNPGGLASTPVPFHIYATLKSINPAPSDARSEMLSVLRSSRYFHASSKAQPRTNAEQHQRPNR